MRPSTILFHLAKHLLYTQVPRPGEEPKLHLFGQLKRIARDGSTAAICVCTGGTYPAQLIYQEIADMACERITAAITATLRRRAARSRPSSTPTTRRARRAHVNFTTSKTTRWKTDAAPLPRQLGGLRQRLGGGVLPRRRGAPARARLRQEPGPRASRCRICSAPTPRQLPARLHRPDRRRHGDDDPLNLIVEIKGYRGEDAKDKANTMDAYWVPGVNNLGTFGRWAFAEFKDWSTRSAANFDALIERAVAEARAIMSAYLDTHAEFYDGSTTTL